MTRNGKISAFGAFLLFTLCVFLLPAAAQEKAQPAGCPGSGPELAIHSIVQGVIGNMKDRGEKVIRTAEEWEALWKQLGLPLNPSPNAPAIDFQKDMVLAVSAGTGRGIVGVEITRIEQRKGCLHVTVAERTLPDSFPAGQFSAFRPFHFIRLSASADPVSFDYVKTSGALEKKDVPKLP